MLFDNKSKRARLNYSKARKVFTVDVFVANIIWRLSGTITFCVIKETPYLKNFQLNNKSAVSLFLQQFCRKCCKMHTLVDCLLYCRSTLVTDCVSTFTVSSTIGKRMYRCSGRSAENFFPERFSQIFLKFRSNNKRTLYKSHAQTTDKTNLIIFSTNFKNY